MLVEVQWFLSAVGDHLGQDGQHAGGGELRVEEKVIQQIAAFFSGSC